MTRQIERAEARRAEKGAGDKYPHAAQKLRPVQPAGKRYEPNGKREVARRLSAAGGAA